MNNRYCKNCHHPIEDAISFCGNCGQKKLKKKFTILDVLKDFFGGLFNLDSKLWRTPVALMNPGFLTEEFFKGRRQRYTPPGRLLLFPIVLFFALVSFSSQDNIFEFSPGEEFEYGKVEEIKFYNYFLDQKDTLNKKLNPFFDDLIVKNVLDTIAVNLNGENSNDSIQINSVKIKSTDLITLNADQIIAKYKVEGFYKQLALRQGIKIKDSPDLLGEFVVKNLSWSILLSIPIIAVILFFLYYRRGTYYTEHVIFLVHAIAFVFILAIPFLLLDLIFKWSLPTFIVFPIWMLYLFVAMKRYYKQGYVKTFVKYNIFLFSYSMIAVVILLLSVIISAILF